MIVTRAISITNFVVASSALCFQVGVLYPWHKQLDEDFEALKKEHLRVLESIRSAKDKDAAAAAAAAAAEAATHEKHSSGNWGVRDTLRSWGAWKL